MKINFYKDKVCLNVLTKSLKMLKKSMKLWKDMFY